MQEHKTVDYSDKGKRKLVEEVRTLRSRLSKLERGNIIGTQGVGRDITERKKAVDMLRESEQRYRAIFEQAADSIVLIDAETGELVEFNDKAHENLGYSREEFQKLRIPDFEIIESTDEVAKHIEKIVRKGADTFETKHRTKDGQIRDIMVSSRAISIGGKNFCQSIWRDITERKQAENALKDSERKLRLLFEGTYDVISLSDANAKSLWVNPAWRNIFGHESEYETDPFSCIHPDDLEKVAKSWQNLISKGAVIKNLEYRYRTPKGEYLHFESSAYPVVIADEQLYYVVARDITERKKLEERLSTIIHTSPIPTAVGGSDGSIIAFNEALETLIGYKSSEISDIADWVNRLYPNKEYREFVWKNIKQALDGRKQDCTEFTIACKDGSTKVVDFHTSFFKGGLVVQMVDITERKQADKALQESEQRFRTLFESAPDGIFLNDLEGRFVDGNDRAEELTGYAKEELIGKTIAEANLLSIEQMPMAIANLEKTAAGKPTGPDEFTLRKKDGSLVIVEVRSFPVEIAGQALSLGIARDITERKESEEALRLERDNFINILNSMKDGVYIVDQNYDIQYVNPVLEKEFGLLEGRKCYQYFHDRKEVCPWCKNEEIFAGNTVRWEWYSYKNQKTYDLIDTPLRNPDGSISKLEILRDITERKQAEDALKESEARFSDISHSIGDIIWEVDENVVFTYCSEGMERVLGYPVGEMVGKTPFDLMAPDEARRVSVIIQDLAKQGKPIEDLENYYLRKDGGVRCLLTNGQPVFDEKGNLKGYRGVCKDITQHKKVEEALRISETRYKSLFDHMSSGVAVYEALADGSDFVFKELNKAGERINNVKRDDVLGRKVTEVFPAVKDFGLLEVFQRVWRTGKPQQHPVSLYADGRLARWFENYVYKLPSGEIVAVHDDVTEGKEAEKTLITYQNDLRSLASKLTSTEEFQRRQIAADLHDNVSQALALSINQLRRLCKSAASGDAKTLDEVCQMIEKSMQNVHDLTFDLASPTLYKIGLEAAISELLSEQLRDRHGIACKFSDDKKDKPLDDNIRVLLFQAVRELLVNVIKHAKAHEVEVAIQRENDKIQISVSDDGVGFDIQEAETSIERGGGFGLFNIRERLDYVGGTFEMHSQPGSGSRFILTAPIKA